MLIKTFLLSVFLVSPAAAVTYNRAVMEGIPATSNTIMVDTTNVRVGVGTASPNGKLQITGVPDANYGNLFVFDPTSEAAGVGGVIAFGGYKTGTSGVLIPATIAGVKSNSISANDNGDLVLSTDFNGTVTEKVRVLNNGNVGIGTAGPGTLLDVNRSGAGDMAYFRNGGHGLNFNIDGSNNSQISGYAANDSLNLWVSGTGVQTFSTGGSERMRIDAAGNVGIGKSPSSALDVNGHIRQTGSVSCPAGAATDANGEFSGCAPSVILSTQTGQSNWFGTPTTSRAVNTVYQNLTGSTIWVTVSNNNLGSVEWDMLEGPTNPPTIVVGSASIAGGGTMRSAITFPVLNNNYYMSNNVGGIGNWVEWK